MTSLNNAEASFTRSAAAHAKHTSRIPRALRSRSMVGRSTDIELLSSSVASGAALITITGTAGIGKTTVAARVASRIADAGGPIVLYCDLSGARDATDLCEAVAAVASFGLVRRHATDEDAAHAAARLLGDLGPIVLFLDELDRLVAQAPKALGLWLDLVPELQIVITSRERLRMPLEVVHELTPLSLPSRGQEVSASEAGNLWLSRVREADPAYVVSEEDAPRLAALLTDLEGLPLAIELAAARAKTLSLGDLASQMSARLDFLARRDPDGERLTLRAAIDASWVMLTPAEQTALRLCSVFQGRITLEGSTAVFRMTGQDARVADLLQTLRDKSLLVKADGTSDAALTHYASIRQYGEEKLRDAGEQTEAWLLHARYFAHYAEASSQLLLIDFRAATQRFERERENLVAAVRRCLQISPSDREGLSTTGQSAGEPLDLALRILGAIEERTWHDCGGSSHLTLLDEVLAHPGLSVANARLVALVRIARGRMAWRFGRLAVAEQDFALALETGLMLSDPSLQSLSRRFLALMKLIRGHLAEGDVLAREAVQLAIIARDTRAEGLALGMLGFIARQRGDAALARKHVERAIELYERVGDTALAANLQEELLWIHLDEGRRDAARYHGERALQLSSALGLGRSPALLLGLGHVALETGRSEEALAFYSSAQSRAGAGGETSLESTAMVCRAVALFDTGRLLEARTELQIALAKMDRIGPHLHTPLVLSVAAAFEASLGRYEDAQAILEEAARYVGDDPSGAQRAGLALTRAFVGSLAAETSPHERQKLLDMLTEAPFGGATAERRILAGVLHRRLTANPSDADMEGRRSLALDASGSWFQPRGQSRIECGARPVMRRMILALARAHQENAGRPMTSGELLDAGWPGERILPAAAKNRVHVMLCRIRDIGLRPYLIANQTGYCFAPDVSIQFVD